MQALPCFTFPFFPHQSQMNIQLSNKHTAWNIATKVYFSTKNVPVNQNATTTLLIEKIQQMCIDVYVILAHFHEEQSETNNSVQSD